jgi:hypothetical protein
MTSTRRRAAEKLASVLGTEELAHDSIGKGTYPLAHRCYAHRLPQKTPEFRPRGGQLAQRLVDLRLAQRVPVQLILQSRQELRVRRPRHRWR